MDVGRGSAIKGTISEDQDFEQYVIPHWKPVKDGGDVIIFLGVGDEMGSGILNASEFLDVTVE